MQVARHRQLPNRKGGVYTLSMRLGVILLRVMFALWLCTGTQIHVALEHGGLPHHVFPHPACLSEAECPGAHSGVAAHASLAGFVSPGDTRCCFKAPKHHHNSGAPHAHWSEALPGGSQRNLPFAHAAVLPLRDIATLPDTAPLPLYISVALPAEAPASHNAALRAPPRA